MTEKPTADFIAQGANRLPLREGDLACVAYHTGRANSDLEFCVVGHVYLDPNGRPKLRLYEARHSYVSESGLQVVQRNIELTPALRGDTRVAVTNRVVGLTEAQVPPAVLAELKAANRYG